MCTESVTITLFDHCVRLNTHGTIGYESLGKLYVSYSNVFRFLCRDLRNGSVSHMFVY